MSLGFIRYFATTNDTITGRTALHCLIALLRIAPVRVISKSGQLEGSWRRFEQLLLTPMTGTYVSCVCTPPAQWIWEASVPMPASDVGAQGAAKALSAPAIGGIAKGTQELYTEWAGSGPRATRVRNVLFVVEPMQTDAQRKTAARYEAVLFANGESVSESDIVAAAEPNGDLREGACVDFLYQPPPMRFAHPDQVGPVDLDVVRRAVLGGQP